MYLHIVDYISWPRLMLALNKTSNDVRNDDDARLQNFVGYLITPRCYGGVLFIEVLSMFAIVDIPTNVVTEYKMSLPISYLTGLHMTFHGSFFC